MRRGDSCIGLCTAALIFVTSLAAAAELPPEVAVERARQVAEILGAGALAQCLRAPAAVATRETLENMREREDALLQIEDLSLLVDSAIAQLQREEVASSIARSALRDRNTSAVANWNIAAVLIGNGMSAVGTGLQFGNQTVQNYGDAISIGGAVIATAFSIVALVLPSQGRPPHAIETNILAPLFGKTPTQESVLPNVVWRYLDTPLVGEHGSFRSQLVERFEPKGPGARQAIELMTKPISKREVVPTDLLDQRLHMLSALRSSVATIKVDLRLLIQQVRACR